MKSCNCITMITGLQETGSILAVAPPLLLLLCSSSGTIDRLGAIASCRSSSTEELWSGSVSGKSKFFTVGWLLNTCLSILIPSSVIVTVSSSIATPSSDLFCSRAL